MRVRILVARLLLFAVCAGGCTLAQESVRGPSLLLTPRLLRRLQRDRERQTVRWVNFEKRVQSAPESPERGFELALYYAVTHDRDRGREAVAWALAHKTQKRQLALVLDWTADVASAEEQRSLRAALQHAPVGSANASGLRDALFASLLDDKANPAAFDAYSAKLVAELKRSALADPAALYAACEYLMAYRAFAHADVRDLDPKFFNLLPKALLLNLKPEQVEAPPLMVHAAALALVTLDPNLENSQYLQGWAMEDRQTIQDGPGVAYELMWADPYLPGIAYQNMDPWVYDDAGTLFARTDWSPGACWLHVFKAKEETEHCTLNLASQPQRFGTLTLVAMTEPCMIVPSRVMREAFMLWKLKPGVRMSYDSNRQKIMSSADDAGLWTVPAEISGRVCAMTDAKR